MAGGQRAAITNCATFSSPSAVTSASVVICPGSTCPSGKNALMKAVYNDIISHLHLRWSHYIMACGIIYSHINVAFETLFLRSQRKLAGRQKMSNQLNPRDVITYLPIPGQFGLAAWLTEYEVKLLTLEEREKLVELPIYALKHLAIQYWKRGYVDAKDVRRITGDKSNEALIRRFLDLSDGADGCAVEVVVPNISHPVTLWIRVIGEDGNVDDSFCWKPRGEITRFNFDRKLYLPVKFAKDIVHAAMSGAVTLQRDWDPDIAGDGSGGWWVTSCHDKTGQRLTVVFDYLGFMY
jgi:hypothetical protein